MTQGTTSQVQEQAKQAQYAAMPTRSTAAKDKLVEVMQLLREQANSMDDPRGAALYETSAEVLQGLVRAHDHYANQSETAWQDKGAQPKKKTSRSKKTQEKQGASAGLPRITREDVRNRLDSAKPTVIFDARSNEAWEASESKLPGAIRVQAEQLADTVKVPEGSMVVVYASDSTGADEALINMAMADVEMADAYILDGGFDAWQAADFPLENKTVKEKQLTL